MRRSVTYPTVRSAIRSRNFDTVRAMVSFWISYDVDGHSDAARAVHEALIRRFGAGSVAPVGVDVAELRAVTALVVVIGPGWTDVTHAPTVSVVGDAFTL